MNAPSASLDDPPVARLAEHPRPARERLDRRGLRHAADPRRRALRVGVVVLPRDEAPARRPERGEGVEPPGQLAARAVPRRPQAAAQPRVHDAPARQLVQLDALPGHVLEDGRAVAERPPLARPRERRRRPRPRVAPQVEEHRRHPPGDELPARRQRLDGGDDRRLLAPPRAVEHPRRLAGAAVGGEVRVMTVLADGLAQQRPAQGGRHGRVALEPRQLIAPPRRLLGLAPRAVDAVVVERPQRGHGLHRPVRARQRRGVAVPAASRGEPPAASPPRVPPRSVALHPFIHIIGACAGDPQTAKGEVRHIRWAHHDTRG